MTFCSALFEIVITAIGVAVGYWVAVAYDRKKTENEFKKALNLSMNALVSSLKTNSKYIDQMFTVEFANNTYPSYPLDTTALALINFGARPYLPKNTDWPDKFNRLRFEMEHINRRLLMEFICNRALDVNSIKSVYQEYKASGQIPPIVADHTSAIIALILRCKSALDSQIEELEKYGYKGEVIKPY